MVGTTSDKCYIYFDKVLTLTVWVKSQYTGTQGENNLYYHNETILGDDNTVLDAGDNSYRYAGASDTTNNFVCFGSDASTCPDDNLYRTIGVFGDQVKLIKWDYATTSLLGTAGVGDSNGSCADNSNCNAGIVNNDYKGSNTAENIGAYMWNYVNSSETNNATNKYNVWSYSKLNTVNLNTNFLNNIGTEWENKIAETTWKVGGNTYANICRATPATAYTNEITSPSTDVTNTYKSKVGLMYTSDYGFAASPSAWTFRLGDYNSYINNNWMHMGLNEWTIVRNFSDPDRAFSVERDGSLYYGGVAYSNMAFAVRPVFYLNSDVTYVSGTGTQDSPIRIN